MLTARQVETIAYQGEGFILHRECAIREYSTVRIERADAGLDHGLTPLIRYTVNEWAGEESYTYAEERLSDFEDDHPRTAALLGLGWNGRNRHRMLDRLADKFPGGPTCDRCYGFIAEPPLS